MPSVVKMSLLNLNGQPSTRPVGALNQSNIAQVPSGVLKAAPPASLNSPMVNRIFNAKPGCGSCGRH